MHVPPAAFLALVAPMAVVLMLLGLGPADHRRRRSARRAAPAEQELVLRGESLFLSRVDAWTVGLDCLLAPAGTREAAVPVHLRLRCPLVEWHHAMVLIVAMVGRWTLTGAPVAVEVTTGAGRCPRARLAGDDASVVLDVENPFALRALERHAAVAGRHAAADDRAR